MALLGPLRELLSQPPFSPSTLSESLAPFKWLLDETAMDRVPYDGMHLERGYVITANLELGFPTPSSFEDGDTFLEIECLDLILDRLPWLIEERSDVLSLPKEKQSNLIDEAVWHSIAEALPGLMRSPAVQDLWQLTIGWLLQPEVPERILKDAVKESLRELLPREVIGDMETVLAAGFAGLYTNCRALHMLEPSDDYDSDIPSLNEMGRATAIAMLRCWAGLRVGYGLFDEGPRRDSSLGSQADR